MSFPEQVQAETLTRRLVVVDNAGAPRIVAEVVNGAAELRIQLPNAAASREVGEVGQILLYAIPTSDSGLGATVGLQLWADGNAIAEVSVIKEDGRWHTQSHRTR